MRDSDRCGSRSVTLVSSCCVETRRYVATTALWVKKSPMYRCSRVRTAVWDRLVSTVAAASWLVIGSVWRACAVIGPPLGVEGAGRWCPAPGWWSQVTDALRLLVVDEHGHDVLGHLGADQRHGVLRGRAGAVGVLLPQLHLLIHQVVVVAGPALHAGHDLLVGVGLALRVDDLGLEDHRLVGAVGVVDLDDEVPDRVGTGLLTELLEVGGGRTGDGDGGGAAGHELGLVDAGAGLLDSGLLLGGLLLLDGGSLGGGGLLSRGLLLDRRGRDGLLLVGEAAAREGEGSGGRDGGDAGDGLLHGVLLLAVTAGWRLVLPSGLEPVPPPRAGAGGQGRSSATCTSRASSGVPGVEP